MPGDIFVFEIVEETVAPKIGLLSFWKYYQGFEKHAPSPLVENNLLWWTTGYRTGMPWHIPSSFPVPCWVHFTCWFFFFLPYSPITRLVPGYYFCRVILNDKRQTTNKMNLDTQVVMVSCRKLFNLKQTLLEMRREKLITKSSLFFVLKLVALDSILDALDSSLDTRSVWV